MAQTGTIVRRGAWWFLRYYEPTLLDGKVVKKQKAKKIVRYSREEYPDAEAVRNSGLTGAVLAPINTKTLAPESPQPLVEFLEHVFLPLIQKRKKPSTYRNYSYRFSLLKPFLAGLDLKATRSSDIQRALQAIADAGRQKTLLRHCKAFLSGAFREAILSDLIQHNPVTATIVPEGTEDGDKRHYSFEEVEALLAALKEPAKTICLVAAFTGLSVGELSGLMWSDIDGDELTIRRLVYKGAIGTTKTKARKAAIPLLPIVLKALAKHRKRSAGEYIFAGSRSGKPVWMENVLALQILPRLEEAKVEWKGFHAFRRGLATNLHRLGVEDLVISRILRHSNVATTRAAYIQQVPKVSKDAMKRIERAFLAAK
jgi:integrase